jgi:hypothetical protein
VSWEPKKTRLGLVPCGNDNEETMQLNIDQSIQRSAADSVALGAKEGRFADRV